MARTGRLPRAAHAPLPGNHRGTQPARRAHPSPPGLEIAAETGSARVRPRSSPRDRQDREARSDRPCLRRDSMEQAVGPRRQQKIFSICPKFTLHLARYANAPMLSRPWTPGRLERGGCLVPESQILAPPPRGVNETASPGCEFRGDCLAVATARAWLAQCGFRACANDC